MADIDWPALGRGILWVFGLSVALAALSHGRWAAKREGVRLRIAIGWNSFQAPFFGGLVLFAVGLGLGAGRMWEKAAWAALALLFAWQAVAAARGSRRSSAAAASVNAKGEDPHETNQ